MHAPPFVHPVLLIASAALAAGCYDFTLPVDPTDPSTTAATSGAHQGGGPTSSSDAATVATGSAASGGSGGGTGGGGGFTPAVVSAGEGGGGGEGAGEGGGAGGGGETAAGGGGGAPSCNQPECAAECDGGECFGGTCVDGACLCNPVRDGIPCGNGGFCLTGVCGECVTSAQCNPDEACDAGFCEVNRAVQVSVGTTFSCARDEKGRVYCWGANAGGQLGTGEGDGLAHPDPVQIALPGPAIDVAAGSDLFACAIVADSPNQLYCWGTNLLGNIGVSGADVYAPTRVPVLSAGDPIDVWDVELGELVGCAATPQGPFCWGRNDACAADPQSQGESFTDAPARILFGQLSPTDRVIVGGRFACVTPEVGPYGPYCWGANDVGQQGTEPTAEVCNVGYSAFEVENVTTHLGAHSCAPSGGDVRCWGANTAGQAGAQPGGPDMPPYLVTIPLDPVEVAVGVATSCARNENGEWYCWGQTIPDFAPTTYLPVLQVGIEGLRSLSIGEHHLCGLDTLSGYAYCFGANDNGELGTAMPGESSSRIVLPAP